MAVERIIIHSEYVKPTHGSLDFKALDAALPPDFHTPQSERRLVVIPGQGVAGNHTHRRKREVFFAGGPMELHWQDDQGGTHIEQMQPTTQEVVLFVVNQDTPHAFKNPSQEPIILFEATTLSEHDSPSSRVI